MIPIVIQNGRSSARREILYRVTPSNSIAEYAAGMTASITAPPAAAFMSMLDTRSAITI